MNTFTHRMALKRSQKGITLIEVSIGLIIAAILAAAAFTSFQNNSRRTAVRDNVSTVTEIASELKNKFGRTNSYATLTTQAAVRGVVIPPELRDTGDTAVNPYGGQIDVLRATINTVNDGAALVWREVPVDQCADLILGVEAGAREIAIFPRATAQAAGLALNGATVSTVKDATGVGKQIDPSIVSVQCEAVAGTSNSVDVVFVFGRV